jgi:hypothetical protein
MTTRRHRPRLGPATRSSFVGFRFPPDVIVVAVRWYLRFGLSYRDVEELLAERGVEVDHVTVYRWVQRFTPLLAEAARPCRHAVGGRWFVDETYVKVAGRWRYVYRAIDQVGQVIDVYVSAWRDMPRPTRCKGRLWRPERCAGAGSPGGPAVACGRVPGEASRPVVTRGQRLPRARAAAVARGTATHAVGAPNPWGWPRPATRRMLGVPWQCQPRPRQPRGSRVRQRG